MVFLNWIPSIFLGDRLLGGESPGLVLVRSTNTSASLWNAAGSQAPADRFEVLAAVEGDGPNLGNQVRERAGNLRVLGQSVTFWSADVQHR